MQEDFVRNRRDAAQEYFLKNGNFRQHLNILGAGAIGVTQGRFPANQFNFLQLPEFESQLYLYIVASKNLGDEYYFPLKRKIEATRALIKQNLQVEMPR